MKHSLSLSHEALAGGKAASLQKKFSLKKRRQIIITTNTTLGDREENVGSQGNTNHMLVSDGGGSYNHRETIKAHMQQMQLFA